jgi:WD40 repeat protein
MFSPDDSMILSSAAASTIFSAPSAPLILWDVATGQVLRTYGDSAFSMYDAVLAEDGKTALSVSLDNIVILWRIDTLDELLAWTYTNRYIPELTCEQRALYAVAVQCDENGIFPTGTPFPTLTPMPTGS